MVERASLEDLRRTVEEVDTAEHLGRYEWLSGEASYADAPGAEYVALTCLTMAVDSGRLRLQQEA